MSPHDDLYVGQQVFITKGPWKGLQAMITELLDSKDDYGVSLITQHGQVGVFESTDRDFKPCG